MQRRAWVGLGCMRLSTDPRRDEERSRAALAAAIDAGATLLDTADAYAWDESERGHNERLVAGVRRAGMLVATKGGLTRPRGKWVPDGRAVHLREACDASLRALSCDAIDLYQLHAPDPRVPFETSVRALAALKAEGLVKRIGVSNVTRAQLAAACDLAPIDAVQIALSPLDDTSLRTGVAELALERGLLLLAHTPLGGPKRAPKIPRDPALARIADKHATSAAAIVLAWLYELGAIPLPGATRPETAREAARAASIALDEEDRRALDERFPLGRWIREPVRAPRASEREVVLLAGIPASGKTTRVRAFVERGYRRLNRDEAGGTLKKLAASLDRELASGTQKLVLDNTYTTRASRREIVEIAWKHGAHVRCEWLDTPIEDAQINAVLRMMERHGRVLSPEEMAKASRQDPNVFDPRVQHRYRRELEPPGDDEGFATIERVAFAREPDAALTESATIVSLDAFARIEGAAVAIDRERAARLRSERIVLATAWLPGAGPEVGASFATIHEAVGREIPIAYCAHPAGPPICWCRKPLPGLALSLMRAHSIQPARSRWVGTSSADRTLAKSLGFQHVDADVFFRL
jgi:aryl-alcohol dehydrogenase-like predicted oxidoreductase/predicted kinase